MEHKLVLYHYDGCGPCRRVKDTLKELNLDIEWRDIHASEEALQELLTVGKLQQVPCLFIDDKPLYESSDIISWLRAHYGSQGKAAPFVSSSGVQRSVSRHG